MAKTPDQTTGPSSAELSKATFSMSMNPEEGFKLEVRIPNCSVQAFTDVTELTLPARELQPYDLPPPEPGLSEGTEEFKDILRRIIAEVVSSGPASVIPVPYPQSIRDQIHQLTGDRSRVKSLPLEAIAIHPRYQPKDIKSRKDATVKTKLSQNIEINHPLYPAEMQAVMNFELAEALVERGIWPMSHRYFGHDYQMKFVKRFPEKCLVSAGTREFNGPDSGETELKTLRGLLDAGALGVCIDVTQGDNYRSLWACEQLKKSHPHRDVILGNIVSFDGTLRAIRAGADAVKVGMGPGSPCTTRVVTRVGDGQATAIALCAAAARPFGIPIIGDGGIKNTGDLNVALALGASCGMAGQVFCKTEESAAGRIEQHRRMGKDGKTEVLYFGEASMVAWDCRGIAVSKDMEPEGEPVWTTVEYDVKELLHRYTSAAQSFLTLCGCRSIQEIHEFALNPTGEPVVAIVPESYGREAATRRLGERCDQDHDQVS